MSRSHTSSCDPLFPIPVQYFECCFRCESKTLDMFILPPTTGSCPNWWQISPPVPSGLQGKKSPPPHSPHADLSPSPHLPSLTPHCSHTTVLCSAVVFCGAVVGQRASEQRSEVVRRCSCCPAEQHRCCCCCHYSSAIAIAIAIAIVVAEPVSRSARRSPVRQRPPLTLVAYHLS